MASTQASDHFDPSSAIQTEAPGARVLIDVVFVHSPGCDFGWSENYISIKGNRELLYRYNVGFTKFFDECSSGPSYLAIADEFLTWLHQIRSSAPKRPLAIVSYQLGGLLVKEALIRCQQRTQNHPSRSHEDLFDSICGLVFIGCPHRGSLDESLVEIIVTALKHSQINTIKSVIEDVRKHADAAKKQSDDFMDFLEAKSPMLTVWSMEEPYRLKNGEVEKVVDETSLMFKYRYERTGRIGWFWNMSNHHRYYGRELDEAFRDFLSCSRRARKLLANKVHLMIPFERNHSVGREFEIEALKSGLLGHPEGCSEVVLLGAAGSGKTELAVELAHQLCEERQDAGKISTPDLYWLRASSQANVESDVRAIAQKIGLIGEQYHYREAKDDIFILFKDWFQSKYSRGWVLIFDEIHDESVFFNNFTPSVTLPYTGKIRRLHDMMPRKPGCAILYVCQDSCSAGRLLSRSYSSNVVNVPRMGSQECLKLVRNGLGSFMTDQELHSQESTILNLVDVLDASPLALACATSYMKTLRQTPNTYLQNYRANASSQGLSSTVPFPQEARETDIARPILQAIRLSISHVTSLGTDTAKLLHFLTILNQAELPLWLLHKVIEPFGTEALKALIDFSIVSDSADNQFLRMHTLVRSVILESVNREEWLESLRETALGLCHVFMEYPKDHEYYTNVKTVASTLAAVGDEAKFEEVLERFGSSFEAWGEYDQKMQTIRHVFHNVSSGDYDTLWEMMRLVEGLEVGSSPLFQYLGKDPNVRRYRYD